MRKKFLIITVTILFVILFILIIRSFKVEQTSSISNIDDLNYSYNEIDGYYTVQNEDDYKITVKSEGELQVLIDNPDYNPQIYEMGP